MTLEIIKFSEFINHYDIQNSTRFGNRFCFRLQIKGLEAPSSGFQFPSTDDNSGWKV
jgi:hypothetical protein